MRTDGGWTFLDLVAIISFVVGLQNLEMNIDQNDMQAQTQEIGKAADELVSNALSDIHLHLAEQDRKLSEILRRMDENH